MMTPNLPHHIPTPERPEPRPVAALSRVEIAGRIHALRSALDTLWCQSEADGGEPFAIIGRAKAELIDLEARLREMDRAAGTVRPAWHSAALASPTAVARLRAAELNRKECDQGLNNAEHAELAALVRMVAVAGAHTLAGGTK
jgi:hypothetical protein